MTFMQSRWSRKVGYLTGKLSEITRPNPGRGPAAIQVPKFGQDSKDAWTVNGLYYANPTENQCGVKQLT